jgi:excisionase family DNA binding protein
MRAVPNDRLMTIDEVAQFLRIAKTTVRKWDREKVLLAVRVGERSDRRYWKSNVLTLLREDDQQTDFDSYAHRS